jgi:hypothetical protein
VPTHARGAVCMRVCVSIPKISLVDTRAESVAPRTLLLRHRRSPCACRAGAVCCCWGDDASDQSIVALWACFQLGIELALQLISRRGLWLCVGHALVVARASRSILWIVSVADLRARQGAPCAAWPVSSTRPVPHKHQHRTLHTARSHPRSRTGQHEGGAACTTRRARTLIACRFWLPLSISLHPPCGCGSFGRLARRPH